ncbi:MAG: hypothetical protein ACYTXA_27345 [Nostoc sp.]
MTRLELKNHQVWQDLTEILENLDANILVQEHLNQGDFPPVRSQLSRYSCK